MNPLGSPLYGQPAAVKTFAAALASDRVHHGWILHGPKGVGKMLAARLFAGLVLDPTVTAAHRAALAPPLESETARLLDAGSHPDFTVIRKELARHSASRELRERKQLNIPLDLLRELLLGGLDSDGRMHTSPVFRTATRGHGKVFVVDEAELLEPDGQNAMLKTLEEPPPQTHILLLTTRMERLLPTIRSRCHHVAFGPLSAECMRQWCAAGNVKSQGATRDWLLKFADGSPGTAQMAEQQSLHDWWIEFHPNFTAMDRGEFPGELAELMHDRVSALAEAIVKENEFASKEAANRQGLGIVAQLAGLHLRERLRIVCEASDHEPVAACLEATQSIERFEENVRGNVNPKLALSAMVAQWTQSGRAAAAAR